MGTTIITNAKQNKVISIENIYKSFIHPSGEKLNVLAGIDFSVNREEFFSIIGPSGCGKSTIFNMIAGLMQPDKGSVKINGNAADVTTGNIGYMMQKDLLFPWRTILENVTLGLEIKGRLRGMGHKEWNMIAMEYLKKYRMDHFANSYPSQLSGGMRQRVALIRTLVTKPDVILLDEPFSALDYQTRLVLEDEILNILHMEHKTCILITHDIEEAVALSDRVAVMSKRPTYVKSIYDIGLSRKHGSALKARQDSAFKNYFNEIWDDLDIQMGDAVNA